MYPHLYFSLCPRPPKATPCPYTTLFRSHKVLEAIRHRQPDAARRAMQHMVADARLNMKQHEQGHGDRKSTRLNSSHVAISYAVFCLKKKKEDVTVRQLAPGY